MNGTAKSFCSAYNLDSDKQRSFCAAEIHRGFNFKVQ